MKRLSPGPTLMDFVRQAHGIVDTWLHQVTLRFSVIRQSTTPTTQEIPNNQWGIFKNTTNGDLTLSLNDEGTVKSTLLTVGGGGGDVLGPASAIDNNVVFFDGTTGKRIKDSGLTLSGTNTGDQTITLTGDITGSGTGSFTTTLKDTGTAGTYVTVTTDAKGRVISGTTTQSWSTLTGTPTTLSGYGITDAQPLDGDLTAIATIAGTSGLLKKTGANTWVLDTSAYITGNQTITFSGDISGSGTTAVTLTLPSINANIGTFNNVTVNSKGQVTGASNVSYLTGNQTITFSGDVTGSGATAVTLTLGTVNSSPQTDTFRKITVNGKGLTTATTAVSGTDINTAHGSQTANRVYAAPNGSAGTPSFRAIVAADIPTLNQNTTGTASNVTGTVEVVNGGTGATTTSGARTNLGLGTIATQDASAVSLTGGSINGITISGGSHTGATEITSNSGSASAAATFTSSGSTSTLIISDAGGAGAGIKMLGDASLAKYIRTVGGDLQIVNNAYSAVLLSVSDSGLLYVPIQISTVVLRTIETTVAGLPPVASVGAGARAFVTDATSTMASGIGTTVAGGGGNKVPVYSDGTNWLIG